MEKVCYNLSMQNRNKYIILLIVGITFILVSCFLCGFYFFNKDNKFSSETTSGQNKVDFNEPSLVLYFDVDGKTARIANYIREILDTDIEEIVPSVEYTATDLDFSNSSSRIALERADPKMRPALSSTLDLTNYQVIYLGYPLWYGDLPSIIKVVLENNDFTGKTVIPFVVDSENAITRNSQPGESYLNVTWLEEQEFYESSSLVDVKSWLYSLKK